MVQILTGVQNKILRTPSAEVKTIDFETKKLIKEMRKALEEKPGVGLAAPQIGVLQRVILVQLRKNSFTAMINPKIVSFSEEREIMEEGCLSLPGQWHDVERSSIVEVQFLTDKGEKQCITLTDLQARIVQHEIDHLDGILFVDRVAILPIRRQKEHIS